MRILAFCGSLRDASYNRRLLDAAIAHAPDGVEIEVAALEELPHYDQDMDSHAGGGPDPTVVAELRANVEAADALLFVTPEFNWSLPGVLKNAIDWASRPAGRSPLAGKPAALMGASPGPAGTGRAQMHLREVLLSTRTPVLMSSVQLGHAAERFDADGRLADEEARIAVAALLEELVGAASPDRGGRFARR